VQSLIRSISNLLSCAIQEEFPDLSDQEIEVVKAKDISFGDYQCNSAMKWAKVIGISPREIASKIVERVKSKDTGLFSSVEVAGPGFINIRLRPSFLAALVQKIATADSLIELDAHPQKIVIDFSSPNIAKEMHVGHLRSTIIGDCLSRVFEFLGHNVLRLNHVGDWGTAFGMLIEHIKSQPDFSLEKIRQYSLSDLMCLYRESKARFDEDPEFRKQAQLEVVALQSGEKEAMAIWQIICQISEAAYQQIYDLLDVRIEVRGESFYNPMLPKIIQELQDKGYVVDSEGAKCLFPKGFCNREGNPLPLMLQKSDGGYTYDTTDMAALAHRVREEHADRIIYVTDSGQSTHFQMLFESAREAKILPPDVRADHVPFGLVLGPDGKKFRTRSGETEKLIDLLEAAVDYAEKILREKNSDWPEYRSIAEILGIGAVKYADLSSHRASDYCFSYDRMLRFEGNTAAFIMYSYVRILSIQRKIGRSEPKPIGSFALEHTSERALAKLILQFKEVLDEIAETLLPNRLTEYLYALSEAFNAFFRDCRVEGDPHQEERLLLVGLTARTLKQGLELLGIGVPERM